MTVFYFIQALTPNPLKKKLSEELSVCVDWMTDNKLSLHLGKTESILFSSKGTTRKIDVFEVKYKDQTVQRKESVKYLGVHLTSQVSFSSLVESIV